MRDLLAFLREAVTPLFTRRMLVPALLLTMLLTATNIVIARNAPEPGATALSPLFLAAAIVRVGGLLVFVVAIMRILAAGPRPPWMPDGAFWLSALVGILLFAVAPLIGLVTGNRTDALGFAISSLLSTLIVAPLAPWLMALAVEKPLAWRPWPWFRDMRAWLLQLIFWSLLLITPPGFVHAEIDSAVLGGVGDWFWPAMLFDGPLSAVIALLGLGLNNAAYRRVARR